MALRGLLDKLTLLSAKAGSTENQAAFMLHTEFHELQRAFGTGKINKNIGDLMQGLRIGLKLGSKSRRQRV